jgi:hypothetical protein
MGMMHAPEPQNPTWMHIHMHDMYALEPTMKQNMFVSV